MLQIQNLSKVFHRSTVNENVVFDNLSVDINDGDFVTIIGSNGAGKSTLLNLISGSIEPDSGSIVLDGCDISRLPEYKRMSLMGRVFQNPSVGTSPSMTILENLSLAYNKGNPYNLTHGVSKKNTAYFEELLSSLSLGLENRLNTKVGLLSGGQRQALSLLMATMSGPKLLLLDEHTAALDPKTSETITALTGRIVSQKNITTLMVTHNLNQAIKLGNRLIMLHHGHVIFDIKSEEKKSLTIEKLLSFFDKTRTKDALTDSLIF